MSNSTIKHQIASIALIGLFIASAAMIGSVGARESFTVIFSPEDVNSETNATYGVTPATSTTKEVKINITDSRCEITPAILLIILLWVVAESLLLMLTAVSSRMTIPSRRVVNSFIVGLLDLERIWSGRASM